MRIQRKKMTREKWDSDEDRNNRKERRGKEEKIEKKEIRENR